MEPRGREAARRHGRPPPERRRTSRSSSGSTGAGRSSSTRSTASMCPATIRAGCAATPSLRRQVGATDDPPSRRGMGGERRPDARGDCRLGDRADRGTRLMTDGRPPDDLAVLVHEIRSPVAALVAIAAAYPGLGCRSPGRSSSKSPAAPRRASSACWTEPQPRAASNGTGGWWVGSCSMPSTPATLPFAEPPVGVGFSLRTTVQDDLIVEGDPCACASCSTT